MIDWEKRALDSASENLLEIIANQRRDLKNWVEGVENDKNFRKRKLCLGRLTEWSDDRPFSYNPAIDSIGLIENQFGVFLYQRLTDNGCEYVSGFPLYEYFSVNNQYLKDGRSFMVQENITKISTKATYPLKDLLQFDVLYGPSIWLDLILGLVLVLVFLVEYYRFSGTNPIFFFCSTIILLLLRILSIYFDILPLFIRFPLFQPINFTSSFLNPTLGDLMVNLIIMLLVVIRLTQFIREKINGKLWFVFTFFGLGISILVFHIPWSILNNSQIALDIGESISFPYLRVVSYFVVSLVCVIYFIYVVYYYQFLKKFGKWRQATWLMIISGIIICLLNPLMSIPVFSVLVLGYILSLQKKNREILFESSQNLFSILLVAIGLGFILSLIIYKHGERDVLFAKRKFANYLLLKHDVLGEYYLSKVIGDLSGDPELLTIASEQSKSDLEERILEEFTSSYFNKYEIEIVFQNYQRLQLDSRYVQENSYLIPENESDYEGIYFVDQGINFKYISKLYVGDVIALIVLRIKKRVPSTVYPALLTDSKYLTFSNEFDYAVFANGEILFHRSQLGQGEWPDERDFMKKKLYEEGIEKNGKHYYGVKTEDGRIILIISDKYELRVLLANFSFLFLVLLSVFMGCAYIQLIFNKQRVEFNFTSKIQTFLAIAFIAPLFITGFALLTSLNNSYKEEINRSYLKQALYISEMLSEKLNKEVSETVQSEILAQIGSYIQSDISFYNSTGYLISTSQPDIFSLSLQSNLVNPIVFEELVRKENQSIIADESIGNLEYKVCYAVVNAKGSNIAGFIAMPFFDSKNHLNRQQIEVFESLITIFGIIFIFAAFIGNMVLNNVLYPLRMVAGKIRKVTLQEINKPIQYESSDEIGSLVKDYNQMLVKLEESKKALARSHKETAWKEIAKQVAHEIKNPLTPMQLKIQQLLRNRSKGEREYEALTSLLTQVDTLSQIASSFSAFAEMPAPNNQVFMWNELVGEVIQLFQSDKVRIETHCEPNISIEADRNIFKRILNNLVLNAIQATEKEVVVIEISLTRKADKCILSIRDSGKGIADGLKEKIFLSHFSTKSAGSGIGLALAKKGIENVGGNIWFDSKEGEGTTFYVSMPLAR